MDKFPRFLVLAVFIIVTGVFWSHFPAWRLVVLEIVRPCLASVLICGLWPSWTSIRKLWVSAVAVIIIQAISSVSYGLSTGFWYIIHDGDGETRPFILICLCADLIILSTVVGIDALFRPRRGFESKSR